MKIRYKLPNKVYEEFLNLLVIGVLTNTSNIFSYIDVINNNLYYLIKIIRNVERNEYKDITNNIKLDSFKNNFPLLIDKLEKNNK